MRAATTTCEEHHNDYVEAAKTILAAIEKEDIHPGDQEAQKKVLLLTRQLFLDHVVTVPKLYRDCAIGHMIIIAGTTWLAWAFAGAFTDERARWAIPVMEYDKERFSKDSPKEIAYVKGQHFPLSFLLATARTDYPGALTAIMGDMDRTPRGERAIMRVGCLYYGLATAHIYLPYGYCLLPGNRELAKLTDDQVDTVASALDEVCAMHPTHVWPTMVALDESGIHPETLGVVLLNIALKLGGPHIHTDPNFDRAMQVPGSDACINALLCCICTNVHGRLYAPVMARKLGQARGWVKDGAERDRFIGVKDPAIAYASAIIDQDDEGAKAIMEHGAGLGVVSSGLIRELEQEYGTGKMVWLER